ncbi:hypothetical protein RQP46_010198 [Phenoliferia psychrophenolica]
MKVASFLPVLLGTLASARPPYQKEALHAAGVKDVLIIEARSELGGRVKSTKLPGTNLTIELGVSSPKGRTNPIYTLAQKHKLKDVFNDWEDISFYDKTGEDLNGTMALSYEHNGDQYQALLEGAGERIASDKVDLTARSGYQLTGERRRVQTPHDWATEYYNYDWEYAQTPEQSSWIATGNNYNYTFDEVEGFGGDNRFVKDQRGFKTIIEKEAAEFLDVGTQVMFNSVVDRVTYDTQGVSVRLTNGTTIRAGHVITTFSVGVLQTDAVEFVPTLPDWKQEAIQSMKMATYTKIFLVFPTKFWHDTEMGLFADPHQRGRYPVWQSLDHRGFFPGSHIYFVTITGDESQRVETLSNAQIQTEIMGVLKLMYPAITVPEPTTLYLDRWHADPLYREHMNNLRASIGGRVHFAGEYTSLDYYGYLHGAYFEGETRGNAVGKCIQTKDCSGLPTGGDFTALNQNFHGR